MAVAEPRSLARHIRHCFERSEDLKTPVADAKLWYLALQDLIKRGALAEAIFAAQQLSAAFPESIFIRQLAMLLDRMPPAAADPSFASFVNHEDQTLQVVRRVDATATLLAFCGRHGSLGMPLPIAHRWFGPLGVHVIYLRDPLDTLFDSGIPGLAEGRAATVSALRSLAESLGTTRIVCYGNSTGGHAALLYGLETGAETVLAFNAFLVEPSAMVGRRTRVGAILSRHDLRSRYLEAPKTPRVHLVYGALSAADAASADTMSGIPGVTIEAVPGSDGHDAHIALIEQGRFGPLLHAFTTDQIG